MAHAHGVEGASTDDGNDGFVSRRPRNPLLAGLVDRVWAAAPTGGTASLVEWVLPTGRPQMILSPAVSVFAGPKVVATRIERRVDQPSFGVSIAAGATSSIVGFSGADLCGETVPLDSMLDLGSMPDQLAERSGHDALDRLEDELVRRLHPASIDQSVLVGERLLRRGLTSGAAVAALGVDRRRFVPEFRRQVGASPKHYERLCRFNRAVEAMRQPDADPLAQLAATLGYADQAHLSREVRHFGSTTPSRIHRDGSNSVNHVSTDKIFKT